MNYRYQFCGPGTELEKRLRRGDRGKNELDAQCKIHDITYAKSKDTATRSEADKTLIDRALNRIYSRDAKLDERLSAILVSVLMAAKLGLTKIGLGLSGKKMQEKDKKRVIRKSTKKILSRKQAKIIKAAVRKPSKKRSKTVKTKPRVLRVPKFGGGGSLQSILLKALKDIKPTKKPSKKQRTKKCRSRKSTKGSGIYLNPANQLHY